ncbi:MAG TPA: IS66 family transposase zinc-finger binding domain-containing protein, partial [Anaerolineales bacterium]|nr:IS66 family transposase zinc-finger binding domain-containing protein [Anaerolineales bacterium]
MNREELEVAYRDLEVQAAALREQNQRLQQQLDALQQEYQQRLAEIEELKRELFGPKADRLTPEQQKLLDEVIQDLTEQDLRPGPVQDEVLIEEPTPGRPPRPRRLRHPVPTHLETETVTLEPDVTPCPHCGQRPERIGEEVTEELDLIPPRLIRRRIV